MATSRISAARVRSRVLVVPLAVVAVLAVVVYGLGGMSWLTSPTIWGVTLFVAVALLVAARAREHLSRNLLLGLPIVIGGAVAIRLGAWDYLPWLTSPAL